MNKKDKKLTNLNIRIDIPLITRLRAFCKRKGVGVSQVVRVALLNYLINKQ